MNNDKELSGFSGSIEPASVIKDLDEHWEQEGVNFSIKESVFKAEFSDKEMKNRALEIAQMFIKIWNFKNNTKLTVNFNHFWEPKEDVGTAYALNFSENIKLRDNVTTHTLKHRLSYEVWAHITGKARIINGINSSSFLNNQTLVKKSLKDPSLSEALQYYSDEVVDEKRPLYGIYKALEVLIEKLRNGKNKSIGMTRLGKLINENKKYVEQVIETTQKQRHARTFARNLLSEQECRERAKKLIEGYAKLISG